MHQSLVRVARLCVPLVCIVTLTFPSSVREFLYRQLYPLVVVDPHQLGASPDALRALGYRQDDPADLGAFRVLAEATVRSATTDGQRLRLLGDRLYQLRGDSPPWIDGGRQQGVGTLLARMQRGERGLCGHNTLVLAALWRSLGRDFREVRFTTDGQVGWNAAHYGIEVYLPDARRWMYYDVGLNGYAIDDGGQPLSLIALDEHLAQGRDVTIVASTAHQDWDTTTFMSFLRQHQTQVFSLNNELAAFDAHRRFGPLNFGYGLLSKLPDPFDRVMDAITGNATPRLTLSRRPPPPAGSATLHLSASSPIG